MNKFSRFKRFTYYGFLVLAAFILVTPLYAESVFLKDGSIVEGKITKEDDEKIKIQVDSGETREIERMKILRTVYHDNYKNKRYLTKMDGTVLEVYIVGEDKTGYTCRLKLNSPEEITIAKDDVDTISRRKVDTKTNSDIPVNLADNDKRYLTKMDGTVLEVYIVGEDKSGYTCRLQPDSPDKIIIPKNDVETISRIRVVAKMNNDTPVNLTDKDKRYLRKTDGTVLEGYIVDREKADYICRLKLDSPEEITIPKDDVETISKIKVVTNDPKEFYQQKLNEIKIQNNGKLDKITLRNGNVIMGMIVDRGSVYKILTPDGTIEISPNDIESQIITH